MAAPITSRRQSTRQIRSSTTRPLNYYARTFDNRAGGAADNAASSSVAQPGFFPAITHFTDAVDALPQEMVRHFSMLKEVEAKVHQPDEELRRLSDSIARLPPPQRSHIPTHEGHFPGLSAQNSIRASRNGSVNSAFTPMQMQAAGSQAAAGLASPTEPQTETERLQLFRQLNYTIMHLAPMLDEKMAVLSTANQILQKQLDRLESSYRYVGEEISDEARFGSVRHWAFVTEKETKKPPERARRENAGTSNYAAAADDFAALRSEARREAVQAKKAKRHQLDSDFDDPSAGRKGQKSRKNAVEAADGRSVGLGIINGVQTGPKKRKVPAAAAADRSGVSSFRASVNQSPRETPAVEASKKRARAAPNPASKRRNQPVGVPSPHLASSPLIGVSAQREAVSRPTTARARQNSTATLTAAPGDTVKVRPPSSASNKAVNVVPPAIDISQPDAGPIAPTLPVAEQVPEAIVEAPPNKQDEDLKREEAENAQDVEMPDVEALVPTVISTRAGRASKTATPLTATFPEIPQPRVRSSRTKDAGGGSHASSESGYGDRPTRKKRTNGASAPSLLAEAAGPRKTGKPDADEDRDSAVMLPEGDRSENPEGAAPADADDDADEEMEVDENEPRYCYCNGVSYGEMVACDNDDCPREWFHLKCAGLKEAPGEDSKWYCNICKETMGKDDKRRRRD